MMAVNEMSDDSFPTKVKKRNKMSKILYDQNEWKGAFSLKVPDPRKGEYKRKHMRVNEVDYEDDD